MIVDVHTHIGRMGGKGWIPEDLLSSMDKAGIDYSLVIVLEEQPNQFSMEDVIKICEQNSRLKAIGKVDFHNISKETIEKLENYLKEGKIFGVKFYTGYQRFFPNDSKLHPIYEFCQKNEFPVIYHTGALETGFPGLLKSSHPLNIDEVADLFPDLKIVIAHMGNPWIMDCAAVIAKNKNVYMDFSGYFVEYKPIRKEEIEMFVRQLKDFKIFTGFNKCLFGTDWPLYGQKEYLAAVKKLPMSSEEKELVFWKNAKEIFNLDI